MPLVEAAPLAAGCEGEEVIVVVAVVPAAAPDAVCVAVDVTVLPASVTVVVVVPPVTVNVLVAEAAIEAAFPLEVGAATVPVDREVADAVAVLVEYVTVLVAVSEDGAPPEGVELAAPNATMGLLVVVVAAALVARPDWSMGLDCGRTVTTPTSKSARASPPTAPAKKPFPLNPALI